MHAIVIGPLAKPTTNHPRWFAHEPAATSVGASSRFALCGCLKSLMNNLSLIRAREAKTTRVGQLTQGGFRCWVKQGEAGAST